jgi:hypothetical protein
MYLYKTSTKPSENHNTLLTTLYDLPLLPHQLQWAKSSRRPRCAEKCLMAIAPPAYHYRIPTTRALERRCQTPSTLGPRPRRAAQTRISGRLCDGEGGIVRGRWMMRVRSGLVFEALGVEMRVGDEELGLEAGRGWVRVGSIWS